MYDDFYLNGLETFEDTLMLSVVGIIAFKILAKEDRILKSIL